MIIIKHFCQIFVLILSILFLLWADLPAEWIESIDFRMGNLKYQTYVDRGNFLEISESPYVLYYDAVDVFVLDKDDLKIRGSLTVGLNDYINSNGICSGEIVPDTVSGWYFYYIFYPENCYKNGKFGRLHIDPQCEIVENEWFMRTTSSIPSSTCNLEKSEIWFFTEKIIRLNVIDETWSEFDYPLGWDYDCERVHTYPVLEYGSIIGIAYGRTIKDRQAFILDVDNGTAKAIVAEEKFFNGVDDIQAWNNHINHFVILGKDSIYSYNYETGEIKLLIDGLNFVTEEIIQDETGMIFYLPYFELNTDNVEFTNGINIVDLNEKTVESKEIILNEGYHFTYLSFFDPNSITIIMIIQFGTYGDREVIVINLDDFSYKTIENSQGHYGQNWLFLENENRLFCISDPFIRVADLELKQIFNSIPLHYKTDSWNIIDDLNKPILLDNQNGPDFIRILPDFSREPNNIGIQAHWACQFPDGFKGIIGEGLKISSGTTGKYYTRYTFNRYDFESKIAERMHIPYECDNMFTDTKNNQIIGSKFSSGFNLIEFISPDNFITSWFSPEGLDLKSQKLLFDEQNSILWALFKNKDNNDLYFYKFSTTEKSLLDTFILADGVFTKIVSIVMDPLDRFLFIIDETDDDTQRDLAIFDISKKEIVKRFLLQTGVKHGLTKYIAAPGIIPIPQKDILFLWDHENAWSMDLYTMEVIYGETVNNPQSFNCFYEDIYGEYLEEKDRVLVVDFRDRVLEIELSSGNIVNEIILPASIDEFHITKEKDKILLLSTDRSIVYTLHLVPAWEKPATIYPTTNFIQFGEGDKAKFTINIKNDYEFSQDVTAYIWLYAPIGVKLYFNGYGMTTDVGGIPLTLPANLDITGDILTFTMPSSVPEGFYNFNAVLINENGDRGPIGTWNFYVKD